MLAAPAAVTIVVTLNKHKEYFRVRNLTINEVESVSGGGVFDDILKAKELLELAAEAYAALQEAYEMNAAAYGEDYANELLAAGGLGA